MGTNLAIELRDCTECNVLYFFNGLLEYYVLLVLEEKVRLVYDKIIDRLRIVEGKK